tara:strand:+ start:1345 stop:1542 length:198 start_codon:yes stop_codon:yes gene_type:complete
MLIGLKIVYTMDTTGDTVYHVIQDTIYNEPGLDINPHTNVDETVTHTLFDMDILSKWNSMLPIAE